MKFLYSALLSSSALVYALAATECWAFYLLGYSMDLTNHDNFWPVYGLQQAYQYGSCPGYHDIHTGDTVDTASEIISYNVLVLCSGVKEISAHAGTV